MILSNVKRDLEQLLVEPRNRMFGICQITAGNKDVQIWLKEGFEKWDKYTGNSMYPVPHEDYHPNDAYALVDDVWVGKYGEDRKELVRFLISLITEV